MDKNKIIKFAAILTLVFILQPSFVFATNFDFKNKDEIKLATQKWFKAICEYRIKLNKKYPRIPVPKICKVSIPEVKPATLEFSVSSSSIQEGESTTLSWTSENTLSCEASGAWSGERLLSGEEAVSPLVDSTYTLTCDGADGGVEKSVSVSVIPLPPPPLDVCENLEGVQESVPDGYHKEGDDCIIDDIPDPVLDHIIISEFYYKGAAALEWVEIYNNTGSSVLMEGWTISDGNSGDVIPTTNLPDQGFAVIVGSTADIGALSLPEGTIVITLANSTIGSGLNDTGNDSVTISDSTASVVDSVSYGTNEGSVPFAPIGQSIYRTSLDVDTGTSLDWANNTTPTPGSF